MAQGVNMWLKEPIFKQEILKKPQTHLNRIDIQYFVKTFFHLKHYTLLKLFLTQTFFVAGEHLNYPALSLVEWEAASEYE